MRAAARALAAMIAVSWPVMTLAQQDGPVVTGKPTLVDPTEAASYDAAEGLADPAAKASALTAFAQQYPASSRKLKALQQAMAAYQQLNDTAQLEPSARRVLEADPKDAQALALVVFIERTKAQTLKEGPARMAMAKQAADDANRGLTALDAWVAPSGTTPDDATFMRNKLSAVLYGALGFDRLVNADYAIARYYYLKAVRADPSDVQTDYQFAMVNLRAKPLDPEGFWWAARAYNLAGQANATTTQATILSLAQESYRRWHGSDEGWAEILIEAASETSPPTGFTVTREPTPAETAVQAVHDNDPGELTLPDWEYVLSFRDASAANREAADKVWAAIMAKQEAGAGRMKLPIKVLSANRGSIEGAITDENRQAGRVDLHVILADPAAPPPAQGSQISVEGALVKYTADPFAFTMQKAQVTPN